MRVRILSRIVVAAVLFVGFVPLCQADPPKLGLTITVDGDGILNPVVKTISVTKVEKGSLAEAAGIVGGDEIIQIEGQTVAGRRGKDLQTLMKFQAGETRTLRLKHADGKQFDAKLTKPKE